jgi:N6-adenosine-specific RNA methylase IME4
VWVKDQGVSLGHYWRNEHEILLLGVKGNQMFNKVADRISSSVFNASRTDHSRKPGGIRELIKQVSPGPHIELFGRERVTGWDVWGNEVEDYHIAA